VISYDVLVALAKGLAIPPERMGLSWWGPEGRWYGPEGSYPGGVRVAYAPKGVDAEMLRRHLIAWGGVVMAGAPVAKVGELLDDLGTLDPVPMPSRLSYLDVARVRDMTRRLAVGDTSYADPGMAAAAAAGATGWLDVPGPEPVTRSLMVAVAELRIEAGWGRQISRTMTAIVLATVHVRAGEQHGLQLAHRAITDATKLTSVRIRKKLLPLAQALESRPGSDTQQLARMARQVAA
jgi:hypothetical protein